jgi:carbon monoxide dehydrogenase subunit G
MERTFRFDFDVELPRHVVWQTLSDTQRLNQLIYGLPASQLVHQSVKNAELSIALAGRTMRYVEEPVVFVAPMHYTIRRRFIASAVKAFVTTCTLDAVSDVKTSVRYAVFVQATGLLAPVLLPIIGSRMRAGVDNMKALLRKAESPTAPTRVDMLWPPPHNDGPAVRERAGRSLKGLRATLDAKQAAILDHLVDALADSPDTNVARMRPYVVAGEWGTDRTDTLAVFLRAAHAGVLRRRGRCRVCPTAHKTCSAPLRRLRHRRRSRFRNQC